MNAVIIEDEEIIATVLQKKLLEAAPDLTITTVLPSLKTAYKWFSENKEPDILFMDIQLSDGVSFDLLKRYTISCPIIFTTAYDEYALQAFKVNGVDYLLKPVDITDLKKAVDKCRKINNQAERPPDINELLRMMASPGKKLYKERFLLSVRNQLMPVNTSEIACFIRETLTYVYLFNGDKFIIDYNIMDELEQLLHPQQFYRANRQTIIHINAVFTIKQQDNAKLIIRLKEPNQKLEIDMSREKAPSFKKWIDQ
ncbi:MAG: LytTR family DNA-binding domain-containing protein [Bacteroidota bacterium]